MQTARLLWTRPLCCWLLLWLGACPAPAALKPNTPKPDTPKPKATAAIFTSIDTMKESRDTLKTPLTEAAINQDVRLTASLHTTHITVDTPYDDPAYMRRWVSAVRRAGRKVWFRCAFNAWEGSYGVKATMTPADYLRALKAFIAAHPTFFRPGDILDPLPEPENGPYWARTSPYGDRWTWQNAPNATTDEYNRFFLQVTRTADQALQAAGIRGVITTVRSTNGYIAARPSTLYASSVAAMGRVTTDSYVGQDPSITPTAALAAFRKEITGIEEVRRVPLVIGEFGYSTQGLVGDVQQEAVLKPEFDWLRTRPYIAGVNYWHGAGYPAPDRYNGATLFAGTTGQWHLRPAARALSSLYAFLLESHRRAAFPSAGGVPSRRVRRPPRRAAGASFSADGESRRHDGRDLLLQR